LLKSVSTHLPLVSLKILPEEEAKATEYNEKLIMMFCQFIFKVQEVTNNVNFYEEFLRIPEATRYHFDTFSNQMALLIDGYLKNNIKTLEVTLATHQVEGNPSLLAVMQSLEKALQYMV
jgi:hypothetical protein